MRLQYYLSEAAVFKMSSDAQKLIKSVISKKIGENLYPLGLEEFKSSDGRDGYGARYITNNGKMIRFNWLKKDDLKSTFTSVDIWNSLKNLNKPDKTVYFPDNFNILQSIDTVVQAFAMAPGSIELNEDEQPVKRKRGRPRKIQVTDRESRTINFN